MNQQPEKFLRAIAKAYFAEYTKQNQTLDSVCFVFPNKRSGTFFLQYLKECVGSGGYLAPHVTTISDFVENLSGRVIDSRVDLLMRLYRVYCDYSGVDSTAEKVVADSLGVKDPQALQSPDTVEFDRFRIWGEMVLADFNDIEMYMVDTDQIFRNIKNNREIESAYLTEEQVEVMKTYFGVSDYERHRTNFWLHYNNPQPIKGNKAKFFKLWEILSPLYDAFCKSLEQDGLTFSGLAYRQALENIRQNGANAFSYSRIVFIGFNALSTVEWSIFKAARNIKVNGESIADFYWDYTDGPMAQVGNTAGHFVQKNVEYFPSKYKYVREQTNVTSLIAEEMQVISSPSGVAQAKIIGELLKKIYAEIGAEGFNNQRVAVVLPDESLLMPLLYSLPEYFTNDRDHRRQLRDSATKAAAVNITMGYSLRNTTAAALVGLLRKLQTRKKLRNNRWEYMRDDVINIISHPFIRILLTGAVVDELLKLLNRTKRIVIDADALTMDHAMIPALDKSVGEIVRQSRVLEPLSVQTKGESVIQYVDHILNGVLKAVTAYYSAVTDYSGLEIANLKLYRRALHRLSDALEAYHIQVNLTTIFSLLDKLLGSETITFEGEPLLGLQIMGPLETRCLDFDYIIIPSMNERVYPRKLRSHTFIPNSLRYGYGMATTRFQESIFSYNFYRMISRAKKVYMIYDARNEGLKTGDVSRYVMQLKYLYAKDKIQHTGYRFAIGTSVDEEIAIPKKGKVLEALNRYFTAGEGAKYFSATALNKYVDCPMAFCLEKVMYITEKDEPEEFLSAASVGNIVHAVMADLYIPDRENQGRYLGSSPRTISKEYIENLSDDFIDAKIRRCICEEKLWTRQEIRSGKAVVPDQLPDGLEVYMDSIRSVIKRTLNHDKELAPILLYGCEINERCVIDLGDGVTANMKYIIDRMDMPNGATHKRIVDYKTGLKKVTPQDIPSCFQADKDQHVAMQLLFYAHLFTLNHADAGDFSMEIYNLQNEDISSPLKLHPKRGVYNDVTYSECAEVYGAELNSLLNRIRKVNEPFTQASLSSKACTYCVFKSALCNR